MLFVSARTLERRWAVPPCCHAFGVARLPVESVHDRQAVARISGRPPRKLRCWIICNQRECTCRWRRRIRGDIGGSLKEVDAAALLCVSTLQQLLLSLIALSREERDVWCHISRAGQRGRPAARGCFPGNRQEQCCALPHSAWPVIGR